MTTTVHYRSSQTSDIRINESLLAWFNDRRQISEVSDELKQVTDIANEILSEHGLIWYPSTSEVIGPVDFEGNAGDLAEAAIDKALDEVCK